jgi:hypothetical protein
VIWIRSANSHTGPRHMVGRIKGVHRCQHPATRDTNSKIPFAHGGVHRCEKVAVVDEPATDQVSDWHFCVLGLTLDAAFRDEQACSDQRGPVACADIGIDDQFRHAELVLDRREHDALAVPSRCRINTMPGTRRTLLERAAPRRRVS